MALLLLSLVLVAPDPAPPQAARSPVSAGADTRALIEELRRNEYRFNPAEGESGVWSAPNRAQEVRSRVSAAGLEVFPRATSADGAGAAWKLALRTTNFGRSDGVSTSSRRR